NHVVFIETFPGSQFRNRYDCCLESCPRDSRSPGRRWSKESSRAPDKSITRPQKDFSFARLQNKYFAAVANPPTFYARRRSDIFRNSETFVRDFVGGIGFDGEARAGGNSQRDRAVASTSGKRIEVAVECDRAVAGAGIDLAVEFADLNRAVARVDVKLAATVTNLDWAVAGSQRDVSGNSFQMQTAIAGGNLQRRLARHVNFEMDAAVLFVLVFRVDGDSRTLLFGHDGNLFERFFVVGALGGGVAYFRLVPAMHGDVPVESIDGDTRRA